MTVIDLREADLRSGYARHEADSLRSTNAALTDALRALTVAILNGTLHGERGQAALLQARRLLDL